MMRPYLIAFLAVITAGLVLAQQGVAFTTTENGLEQAERLASAGQLDGALAAYRELSEQQPDSARLHTRMGGMLLLKQDYQQAIRSFQTAIGLDAENGGEAYVGLGIAYIHLGRYGPARAALTEARRLKPGSEADLDRLMVWLDGRTPGPEEGKHR